MTRAVALIVIAGFLIAAGCNNQPATPPVASGNSEDGKIKANLDKLSPEDRAIAEQQRVCPVSNEKLGGMGVPIKLMVKDKPVFICCKACESTVKEKPDEMLQKVNELKSRSAPAAAAEPKLLFDGKALSGWEGDEKTWRVEDGAIVGGSLDTVVPRNEFLCTTQTFENFDLRVKFKLLGDKDKANGGVQFRTKRIPKHHEVIGYQADIGQGYWGALYDESRRKTVLAGPSKEVIEKAAKFDDWNEYRIRAEGPHIRLWLNGTLTVDYTEKDEKVERSGIIGLQVHGGGKTKVLYKDITIEELPKK